ncbi:MAG: adenylate/guanylate cyclase domain-containing protein [Pseudomonadota bacterium]
MIRTIERLEEFLALSALGSLPLGLTIEGFGQRCREGGLSVDRLLIGWRLLNPLYSSHTILWTPEEGIASELFRHSEAVNNPNYESSPIKAVLLSSEMSIRRRLSGANAPFDFPMLEDLAEQGFTDYYIVKVGFGAEISEEIPGTGVIISFVSKQDGGFTDDEISALDRLKHMLGIAARVAMEVEMRETLARTYLGRSAAEKVLGGQILRGEGEAIEAVIWYCDLRGSSTLCETMGVDAYLPLLNDFFSATAGPVSAAGGDVLDFIGDAVLAIFPTGSNGIAHALAATREALSHLETFRTAHSVLADRKGLADVVGIAMDTGTVNYGNIGIPERLSFSVIGPTVNKVARLERLAKALHVPVLATASVAAAAPGEWIDRGVHRLDGVAHEVDVFTLQTNPAFADA